MQTIGTQLLHSNQEKFDEGITKRKVALKYLVEVILFRNIILNGWSTSGQDNL